MQLASSVDKDSMADPKCTEFRSQGCAVCIDNGCMWQAGAQSCADDCEKDESCAHVAAECCDGDPNHGRGESWLCDDGCNTCTCDAAGVITAAGCAKDQAASGDPFEATIVQVAGSVCLVVLVCMAGILCLICRQPKGKAKKKVSATAAPATNKKNQKQRHQGKSDVSELQGLASGA